MTHLPRYPVSDMARAHLTGLAEAWEHIAEVNAHAAPGSHDAGLRAMAAHAASRLRDALTAQEEVTRRHQCACGHTWPQHDEEGCMVCGCASTRHRG